MVNCPTQGQTESKTVAWQLRASREQAIRRNPHRTTRGEECFRGALCWRCQHFSFGL
jgi:hypothetical protein